MSAAEPKVSESDETKEHLRALLQTHSEIASAGLDVEQLLPLAVQRTRALTGADGAVVELAEGEELVVRAACGSATPWLGRRRPAEDAAATRSIRGHQNRFRREPPPFGGEPASRSHLSAPLRYRDRVLGLLSVVSGRPGAFGEKEGEAIGHMAELVAASVSHATSFETQALRDPLTGLANRALFLDRLNLALARARRRPSVTVFFVDLDDFKSVNDSLGHAAGDELLAQVAGRLREACRPSDTVARWGGDEFTILADELVGPSGAIELAERLRHALERPFLVGGASVRTSASIGVAQAHDPYAEPERILQVADDAMYRFKRRRDALRREAGAAPAREP